MRLITFQRQGRGEPGVLADGKMVGLRGAGFDSLRDVIGGGAGALERVRAWVADAPGGAAFDAKETTLLAPLPRPPKIVCIGLNYRDHAAESKAAIPEVPTVFAKFPTAATGHRLPIVLPKNSVQAGLRSRVGGGDRQAAAATSRRPAGASTFSATPAFNDVSARDFQMATSQWMIGKTFDTFAPFGPAIVTADEIEDPQALDISLLLNGEVMQRSNTREMIFGIPRLIAHLSSVFTLEPGDIIATGTPAGVGFARKPPRWLKPGDEATVRIEGLGELVNPVVAEA